MTWPSISAIITTHHHRPRHHPTTAVLDSHLHGELHLLQLVLLSLCFSLFWWFAAIVEGINLTVCPNLVSPAASLTICKVPKLARNTYPTQAHKIWFIHQRVLSTLTNITIITTVLLIMVMIHMQCIPYRITSIMGITNTRTWGKKDRTKAILAITITMEGMRKIVTTLTWARQKDIPANEYINYVHYCFICLFYIIHINCWTIEALWLHFRYNHQYNQYVIADAYL